MRVGKLNFCIKKEELDLPKELWLFFPAGMTHVHKGNLVLGEKDKYIVTGWYIKTGQS